MSRPNSNLRSICLLLATPLALNACSLSNSASLMVHRQSNGIMGGQILASDQAPASSVVLIHSTFGDLGAICTGVLIDSDFILTAKHCVVMEGAQASAIQVEWHDRGIPNRPGSSRPLTAVDTFDFIRSETLSADLALLHLKTAAPSNVRVAQLPGENLNLIGQNFLEVGYGKARDSDDFAKGIFLRELFKPASSLRPSPDISIADEIFIDQVASGINSGDSGGPLFIVMPDQSLILIGIAHGHSENLHLAAFADIRPKLSWIKESKNRIFSYIRQ